MPWNVFQDDGRYCVHKLNDDGSKGEQVACHDTEEQARRQVEALYANNPEARAPKTYTAADREKANTMSDGSFPIDNVADLKRAIASYGRGNPPPSAARKAAIKAHIIRRARALGAMDQLPEDWRSMSDDNGEHRSIDFDTLGLEKRSVELSDVDLSGDGLHFSGYAAMFDVEADLGDFTESVSRGAFRKVLGSGQNVPMFYDHDPRWGPLATTGAETLHLREDNKGLRVEADLDGDHIMLPTLRSQVRRGDVSGMSFGFVAGKGNSRIEHRGTKPHRNLIGFHRLLDVSPTWVPAYDATTLEMRSALAALRLAEDLGFNNLQQILSGAYQQLEDGAAQDHDADTSVVEQQEEQRSGVDGPMARAAARKRRLQAMGLTLPRDLR